MNYSHGRPYSTCTGMPSNCLFRGVLNLSQVELRLVLLAMHVCIIVLLLQYTTIYESHSVTVVNSMQTRLHMKTYTNSECLNKLWYPWVLSVEHHTKLRLLLCVLLCVSFIQLLLPCNNTESALWFSPTVGLHQQK